MLSNMQMSSRDKSRIEIAFRCNVALAPREPQALTGITEEIGSDSVVILLDPGLPVSQWPRVGDAVVATCDIPRIHDTRYRSIRCRGMVTQVFLTEDGSPRLEVGVNQIGFAGGTRNRSGARPCKTKI